MKNQKQNGICFASFDKVKINFEKLDDDTAEAIMDLLKKEDDHQ